MSYNSKKNIGGEPKNSPLVNEINQYQICPTCNGQGSIIVYKYNTNHIEKCQTCKGEGLVKK